MTPKDPAQNDKYLFSLYYIGLNQSHRQNCYHWNGLSFNFTGKALQSHKVNTARLDIYRVGKCNSSTEETETVDENNIIFHNHQGAKITRRQFLKSPCHDSILHVKVGSYLDKK